MSEDRVFLDTNVLVYAYSETEPRKRDIARELKDRTPCCISTQVVNEFIVVMTKKVGIPVDDIRAIVQRIYRTIPVLETGQTVILRALDLARITGYVHWDALILAAAIEAGSPTLCSEDLQDGRVVDGVRIMNPFKE
jgi:predicted nucleic acid-binding protein